jgi:hypothetical protein
VRPGFDLRKECRMKSLTLAAMAVAMAMAASAAMAQEAQELVDNPQYKRWASYKPGASCTQKITIVSAPDGNKEVTTTMTLTATLKDLTADKAVIEVASQMEANGQKMDMPARKQEIAAKVAKSAADLPPAPPGAKLTKKGEGDEEITVAGKKYKAHWTEYQSSGDQFEAVMKVWTADGVPGGVLKSQSESTKPIKSKSTMELVEFKAGA